MFCGVLLGLVRFGLVWIEIKKIIFLVGNGKVSLGPIRLGQVRSGVKWHGMVRINKNNECEVLT